MIKLNNKIFREYDIRGVIGEDLSEEFAYLLGRAYASLLDLNNPNPVAIGHDCRITSESYSMALAKGLTDSGRNVELLGMGPTPQLYYAVYRSFDRDKPLAGGIQVTGSHNPSHMNGFKMCRGLKTLSGEDIQQIRSAMENINKSMPASVQSLGTISKTPILDEYADYIIANIKPHLGSKKLKVVVDAGNGVGGMVGGRILRACGAEVIELYCDPDGNFPNHHPDPTEMDNIKDLQRVVVEQKADCGIGWDGDADRIGVVDENGRVVFGDMLLLLYSRAILKEEPNSTIIGDVKCSSRLFDDITKHGGKAIMWKTGHSLVKKKLIESNAALAGEMSGHMFFKHRYFGFDDAMYASARLIEILSHSKGSLSSLLADVPPAFSTPEIRLDCPEEKKFLIAEAAKSYFSKYKTDDIDGVRIQFKNGWGLIRASNTQPALVLRFEAGTEAELAEYQDTVNKGLAEIQENI